MPAIVSHIVEVYPYRVIRQEPEFLLLRRARGALLADTWQAVYGHIEAGETAFDAARREMMEETSLWAEAWHQLESVNTFFLAGRDEIHLCPGFAARIEPSDVPVLNDEHEEFAWLTLDEAVRRFCWPGQGMAVRQIAALIVPGGASSDALKLNAGLSCRES